MSRAEIYLKRNKEESLKRHHPWVFSGAIERAEVDEQLTEGEVVDIFTKGGEYIASGHYQVGSIAVRVLTFEREEIDQQWWNSRINEAFGVRHSLQLTNSEVTTCYRLIHGEGDMLPGLIVDIYGSHAVVQCHSVGMYHSRMMIAEALKSLFGDALESIYDKSAQTLPFNANLGAEDGYLYKKDGNSWHNGVEVLEGGNRFVVNWERGQKTGFS